MAMPRVLTAIAALTFICATTGVVAEEEHRHARESGGRSAVMDPNYQKECGSCHIAFPASMLSAGSWQKLMGGLAKHFGESAELPAAALKSTTDYLVSNAGDGARTESASLRITDTDAFRRKHREVPKRAIKPQGQVASMTDCAACHTRAKEGSFRESEVRIPGLGRWE